MLMHEMPAPVLSKNAETVLARRYLRKNENGQTVETPQELFWRVAQTIAAEEAKYEKSPYKPEELAVLFYRMMTGFEFLPNSPTLMNAGRSLGQLAACFVLPVGDSMEEIFISVRDAALIHKSGGGTGFSFSRLRPAGARVGSTGGVASGPVSFMKIFNTATEQVKQGGTRRGANMGILRVDHPDILQFITCKEKDGELANFNISVALTEEFMQAVEADEEYALIAPQTGKEEGRLKAREVFDLLVRKAWETGDPGIIFIDRINRDNPTPVQGSIESTNPCGEMPLLPYEACNLGSINLSKFWNPEDQDLDWDRLLDTVHLAIRFLDNVIDASTYPLERIGEIVRRNRKVGLGIMGFADLLLMTRLPYGSQEARDLARKIMQFIQAASRGISTILSEERGPFPAFEDSIWPSRGYLSLRNATTTTIAPTGTLSIIAGCSSGIEPLFALSFVRTVMDNDKLSEVSPYLEQALRAEGLLTSESMDEIVKRGSIADMEEIPQNLRDVFVCAQDIPPEAHLRMQAAFQEFTDNAVSKTVNLPNAASEQDIRDIYWMAYKMGCKGVTVYRDGCKKLQVITVGDKVPQSAVQELVEAKPRPDVVYGFTQKVKTGFGDMYLTVNEVDGKPFEVFATLGKSGQSAMAKAEAIGRLVSLALRSGIAVRSIVSQLEGIGGEHTVFEKKRLLKSIPDAVAWVLRNRYMQDEKLKPTGNGMGKPTCAECGEALIFEEGCYICKCCGYTKCG